MAGIDNHVAIIGDWVPPDPSPRTFFSSIMGDDLGSRSFPPLLGGNSGCEGSFVGSSKNLKEATILEEEDGTGAVVSGDCLSESTYLSYQESGSRGGLAERMAARAGFSAPRLNTARIKSANVSLSPDVRSPYLTIPPGLSPTTLLDSPVFLSNSLDQPSPTTGKLCFTPSSNSKSSMLVPEAPDRNKDSPFEYVDTTSFVFKPRVELSSSFFPSAANEETPATNPQQSFANIEVSVHSERTLWSRSLEGTEVHSQNISSYHPWANFPKSSGEKDTNGKNAESEPRVCDPVIAIVEHSPMLNDQQDSEGNQRSNGEINSIVEGGATSEDGYNWRKYGQKQVKGSEYPRSYYKCTHPNCQVKKKVERSHEGHITEIIYKGAHNHPKPPPNRRSAVGCSDAQNDMQLDIPEQARAQAGAEGDPTWANLQRGNVSRDPDWRHENLEATSSASVGPDFCPQSTSMQARKGPHFEATIDVDVSSTMSNNEDENDRGTQRSVSLGYDGEGDESESKRRKLDEMEVGGAAARAIREPRVVVQTTSEVDILDDGYRWRKYGQKVVKGNPNPRSYYKCTNAGCTVRKHVERASNDLKSVITTYEGKHNHDVPAARSSNHVRSCPSSTAPTQVAQPRIHRPEPSQINDGMVNFDGPASVGAFSLPGRELGTSPGFSFGMRQPGLAGLAMAGLGPGLRKLPASPLHPYLGQQRHMNETGLIMPKGEPKNEPVSETGLNLSDSSSVYHQIMGRLPLGSQM